MKPSARHRQSGYTLIEVLAAMAILGTGLLGILAMQAAAITANRRANELTTATNIARLWQERLRRDSYQWNTPSSDNPTPNLNNNTWFLWVAPTTGVGNWVAPQLRAGLIGMPLESAAFDYWGNDVVETSDAVHYCSQMRLSVLIPNQLLRSEVRVWWFREGGVRPTTPGYANCGVGSAIPATMGQDTTNVHWVYMTQVLARHEL